MRKVAAALAAACLVVGLGGPVAQAGGALRVGQHAFVSQASENLTAIRLRVSVLKVRILRRVASNGQVFTPSHGYVFMAVGLRLTNTGKYNTTISADLEMTVQDPTGHRWGPDDLLGTGVDGDLAAHQSVSGYEFFEVPASARRVTFVFNTSFGKPAAWVLPNP